MDYHNKSALMNLNLCLAIKHYPMEFAATDTSMWGQCSTSYTTADYLHKPIPGKQLQTRSDTSLNFMATLHYIRYCLSYLGPIQHLCHQSPSNYTSFYLVIARSFIFFRLSWILRSFFFDVKKGSKARSMVGLRLQLWRRQLWVNSYG